MNGLEIPLAGRITVISDTYSALTSNRLYSKARSRDEAIGIMLQEKDKFDPQILNYFITNITSEIERSRQII
ncbi:HD domain-containing phosphohydrolase [Paenibacillus sp. PL91]|uniref:HD domain-containing phosphohydrolase n=1 Tax=Paenibacillus sp. PL91 TaxID=2729538 RepID=UPI0039834A8B